MIFLHSSFIQFLLITFVCAQQNQFYENTKGENYQKTPYIQISNYGFIDGFISHSAWTKRPIYNFMGIKYGNIPHEGRFKISKPVEPIKDIYHAIRIPKSCPSFTKMNEIFESDTNAEDCLYLNVHSSDLYGRKKPVMFYIHGEFFFDGSADEAKPEYLLEKDIVLVSVQYRLGPFGFLSTKSEEIPGNIAVIDIVNALIWVRENINNFGGDSNRVTIFGQGAGATMAHVLTISPSIDQTLFKNVILQSGSALNPYLLTNDPIKHAIGIAKKANCQRTEQIEELNLCLNNLSTKQLLKAFYNYCKSNEQFGIKHYGGFQLSIADYHGILPQHPAKLTQQDKFHYHPMLGGVTKDVGSFLYTSSSYLQISRARDLDIYEKVEFLLQLNTGVDDEFGLWKNLAVENLFTEHQISRRSFSPGLVDLCSIVVYKAPLLEALQQNAQNHPNETYLYTFNYQGSYNRYNFNKSVLDYNLGVTLSDENIYLFPYPPEVSNLQGDDLKISKLMIDLWTSFAEDDIPKSKLLNDNNWPPMTLISGPYISIDKQSTIEQDFVNEMALNSEQNFF